VDTRRLKKRFLNHIAANRFFGDQNDEIVRGPDFPVNFVDPFCADQHLSIEKYFELPPFECFLY
jgi:hypothetical protein